MPPVAATGGVVPIVCTRITTRNVAEFNILSMEEPSHEPGLNTRHDEDRENDSWVR
jgi:hypothetical protein